MSVIVREAGVDDAAPIARLLAAGSLRSGEDPDDLAGYRAALAEISRTAGSTVLVAEADCEVVAVCQLIMFRHVQEKGGLCAEIESAHVAAEYRGRGVGSRLVAEAVERARRAGCYRVQLTSNKARADAHRFWARQGFEATHEGFKLYL